MDKIFDSGLLSKNTFHDFDQMAMVAASVWDQRYRKLGNGSEFGFAHQLNLPTAQLTHIGWQSGIRIETGTPPGSIGIVLQSAGNNRLRVNGQELAHDEIMLLHSPHDYDLVNADNTKYLVLAVDAERVKSHARAHWGELPEKFESYSSLISESPVHQQQLSEILRSHLKLSYDNPEYLSAQDLQELMIDELLDAVFLANKAPAAPKSIAQRHILAKRAASYLKDNIQGVVTLRSMCEHVDVSERSLRQGFLERFGVTPKTFIKQHRLQQLHDLLQSSSDESLTVTQGALSQGLTHLGRLPREYHALFNELPSQTLKRQPALSRQA